MASASVMGQDSQDKWDGYQQTDNHLEGEDMTLLLGCIEALERALRVGHSSATHDTPSVTNFSHGTRHMQNPDTDLGTTGATGTTHLPTAWQDLTALDSLVNFYFRKGLATSSQKTYEARRKNSTNAQHIQLLTSKTSKRSATLSPTLLNTTSFQRR